MNNLFEYLDELSKTDEKLAELLDVYKEISEVFDSANRAINLQPITEPKDNNTANVTISFQKSPLSSMNWGIDEQKTQQA